MRPMNSSKENNLAQLKKWGLGILSAFIIAFVIWLAHSVNQLQGRESTDRQSREKLESRIEKLESWIDDWYNVLRVPERDQKQDSQILEFRQRIERLEAWRDATQDE